MVAVLVVVGVIIIVLFYLLTGSSKQGDVAENTAPIPMKAKSVATDKAAPMRVKPVVKEKRVIALTPLVPAAVPEVSRAEPKAEVPGHVLKVIATDDVWIKFSIDKKKPFDVLFKKGESRQWLMKRGVSLVIGNAAGVNLVFDGKPMKTEGKPGDVIRLKLPR